MDITIGDFPKLRTRTREMAAKLQPRLDDHLQMIKEQFRPAVVFGSAVSPGTKDGAKDGGFALAQFRKVWTDVAASLNVSEDLPEGLGLNSAKPILCPFVYQHRITTPEGSKDITVKSPLRFILTYPDYPYDALLGLIGASDKRPKLREFALHYTALNFIVTQNRRLLALFEDLRYPVRSEKNERLGSMPLTTIAAPYATARPSDDVIALICDFSGSDTVEEVVDADAPK
jgi:hypothetical protein